ncbi:MAG: helix-turn-helix transcriptional regulator [Betaproteobacteria bacterium]|nr:helix-turn-helix transcriptional regulator [Betaproteobacteria bacterium]
MPNDAKFAEIAALLGETTRATMLHALMDGRALTASELARAARVTPQTASNHLARMTAANLVCVSQQGRHRYYRLASPAVARLIENVMQVAFERHPASISFNTIATGPRDAAMRLARTCYDHLAGRLGVAITDALVEHHHLELTADAGWVTDSGAQLLQQIGIDWPNLSADRRNQSGRVLCRPCLDWSERRAHLAGALGSALCELAFQKDWIRRRTDTRAVMITPKGRRDFRAWFKVRLDD